MEKTIFKNRSTQYVIVTAKESSATERSVAQSISDAFKNLGRTDISVQDEYDSDSKKIIVGAIEENEASASIKASLAKADYTVRFIDDDIYLIGGSDEATAKAWIYFQLKFMHKDMESLCIDDGFVYNSNNGSKCSLTINKNGIEKYRIVHYDSFFAKKCANDIKNSIYNKTGIELTVTDDSEPEYEYEILVGKTNRAESKKIREKYERPHICYDAEVLGNKLVIMAEGYTTLETVSVDFEAYINSLANAENDISGSIISKNIKYYIDVDMIDKASDSDIRVWVWNMEAPYIHDWHAKGAVYFDDKIRAEVMADVLASFFPDIIGTNEFYNSQMYISTYQNQYSTVLRELSDYYVILDKAPYEIGKPDADTLPNVQYGMPENILYKKTSRLSFISSQWRYPPYHAICHGYHQALFELDGKIRFIYSIGHYASSHQDNTSALAHQAAINDAQALTGSAEPLPVIFSGDFFMYYSDVGHRVHTDAGYFDAQKSAEINANNDVNAESYHHVGSRHKKHGCCDFIFHCNKLQAKKFAIMYSVNTDNTSDHYPVCADLKFK